MLIFHRLNLKAFHMNIQATAPRHAVVSLWMIFALSMGSIVSAQTRTTVERAAADKWRVSAGSLPNGWIGYEVRDGKTDRIIFGSKGHAGTTQTDWEQQGDGIVARHHVETIAELTQWSITLRNDSDQRRRLEPAIVLQLDAKPPDASVWDGGEHVHALSKVMTDELPRMSEGVRGRMPLMAVYTDRAGVLIGQHPLDLFSYFSAAIDQRGSRPMLRYAVRTVLEPEATKTVRFLFGSMDPRFGGRRSAAQKLYDAYPEAFAPHPRVHPDLLGASAQYQMHRVPIGQKLEIMRRFGATWEWVYAPFRRTGDPLAQEEFWDYTPDQGKFRILGMFGDASVNLNTISRPEFIEKRRNYFNTYGQLFGLLWYSPAGSWMEKQLAMQQHRDALIEDPAVRYELAQWVSGHDREVLVLPWFTSVQSMLEKSYTRIAQEYDTAGIAMDVARGGPKYRGPAVEKNIPERAWDEDGIFIDQGVGVAKFIDFLHSLPLRWDDRYRLGVIGNPETGGATFMTSVRFDAGMFEGQPYHRDSDAIPGIRLTMGQKPLTWWKGWQYAKVLAPDWEKRGRDHFVKVMNRVVDYVLLQSYQWAGQPTANYLWGVPRLAEQMPLLQETLKLGWQAVVPVEHNLEGTKYLAHYGRGAQTRLFWGNPYEKVRTVDATVHAQPLGAKAWVFADRYRPGTTVLNQLEAEGLTQLHFEIPSRSLVLHQAVLGFATHAVCASAHAKYDKDFARCSVAIDMKLDQPVTDQLYLPRFDGYILDRLTLDGEKADVTTTSTGYTTSTLTLKDAVQIRATYRSKMLHLHKEQLDQFSFLKQDGSASFVLYVDPAATPSARRIKQFFTFYLEQHFPDATLELEIVSTDELVPEDRNSITLSVGDTTDTAVGVTMPRANALRIHGDSFQTMDQALLQLLDVLSDRFYAYPGLQGTWGTNGRMLDAFDLNGKMLPSDKVTP